MGQNVVKREVKKGLELYELRKLESAIDEWNKALHRLNGTGDNPTKFVILGHVCCAYFDMGKYRCIITYARKQLEVAETIEQETEACLNLSRAYERLGEYSIAEEYCKKCLSRDRKDSKWVKYAFLLYGRLYFKQCQFYKGLKNLEEAKAFEKLSNDIAFRILVNISYGQFYTFVNDMETGCMYILKCIEILETNTDSYITKKFHKSIQLELAKIHLENSRLNEALDTCENVMKDAMESRDRQLQGECLYVFAEIHRRSRSFERASPRYESAYAIFTEIGDRYGLMQVLYGMAKTTCLQQDFDQAIDLFKKTLDAAQEIGNKMYAVKCCVNLIDLCDTGSVESTQSYEQLLDDLLEQMGLYCGVCSEAIGKTKEQLDMLPCCHLIHTRCACHLARYTWGRKEKMRPCPTCRKLSSSNPML
ncbi:43 kDa receptor-associated protein of the synapse-like [Mytilus trossulus]|uniref:43 kDa receptor-associated protein of the synapse-like n=1 Tax=Mytilus trossulus TaxID=6551 RepID=UPI0030044DE2